VLGLQAIERRLQLCIGCLFASENGLLLASQFLDSGSASFAEFDHGITPPLQRSFDQIQLNRWRKGWGQHERLADTVDGACRFNGRQQALHVLALGCCVHRVHGGEQVAGGQPFATSERLLGWSDLACCCQQAA